MFFTFVQTKVYFQWEKNNRNTATFKSFIILQVSLRQIGLSASFSELLHSGGATTFFKFYSHNAFNDTNGNDTNGTDRSVQWINEKNNRLSLSRSAPERQFGWVLLFCSVYDGAGWAYGINNEGVGNRIGREWNSPPNPRNTEIVCTANERHVKGGREPRELFIFKYKILPAESTLGHNLHGGFIHKRCIHVLRRHRKLQSLAYIEGFYYC